MVSKTGEQKYLNKNLRATVNVTTVMPTKKKKNSNVKGKERGEGNHSDIRWAFILWVLHMPRKGPNFYPSYKKSALLTYPCVGGKIVWSKGGSSVPPHYLCQGCSHPVIRTPPKNIQGKLDVSQAQKYHLRSMQKLHK